MIDEILQLSATDIIAQLKKKKMAKPFQEFVEQYDPKKHKVNDERIRRKKQIKTDRGVEFVNPTRLSFPFQKIIVKRAAAFLVGEGIELDGVTESEDQILMMEMIKRTWFDNKCDYKTREIARRWMSETEAAEFWYFTESDDIWDDLNLKVGGKFRPKMMVWSNEKGDRLFPYFDSFGDMQAFGREYVVDKMTYFDLYTSKYEVNFRKDGEWKDIDQKTNILEKIPIVYYDRDLPEWYDVQSLIERFETLMSNFSDQNDYFGSPMVLVKGKVEGFAEKGETGKILQLDPDADASYLTWDQAPEAIKLEKESLQELIFSMSQTPDISFQQMKALGNAISGNAIQLMFLDAALKALEHQEKFGDGIQRRINILKSAMSIISVSVEKAKSMHIEPKFTFYSPKNYQEIVSTLVTAVGGKPIMSRKTAVANNPLVIDPNVEMENLKEDEASDFGGFITNLGLGGEE